MLTNRGRQVVAFQPDVERVTRALGRIDGVVVADFLQFGGGRARLRKHNHVVVACLRRIKCIAEIRLGNVHRVA